MSRLTRTVRVTAIASVITAGTLSAGTSAALARPAADTTAAPIGYVYATTFESVIDQLAVEPDFSLKLVATIPTTFQDSFGLALLHTAGGLHLYAEERSGPGVESEIFQFSVNRATGRLTADKVPPVTGLAPVSTGNNLLAFDGRAIKASDASAIYATSCTTGCPQVAFGHYVANQQTGRLKLARSVTPVDILY